MKAKISTDDILKCLTEYMSHRHLRISRTIKALDKLYNKISEKPKDLNDNEFFELCEILSTKYTKKSIKSLLVAINFSENCWLALKFIKEEKLFNQSNFQNILRLSEQDLTALNNKSFDKINMLHCMVLLENIIQKNPNIKIWLYQMDYFKPLYLFLDSLHKNKALEIPFLILYCYPNNRGKYRLIDGDDFKNTLLNDLIKNFSDDNQALMRSFLDKLNAQANEYMQPEYCRRPLLQFNDYFAHNKDNLNKFYQKLLKEGILDKSVFELLLNADFELISYVSSFLSELTQSQNKAILIQFFKLFLWKKIENFDPAVTFLSENTVFQEKWPLLEKNRILAENAYFLLERGLFTEKNFNLINKAQFIVPVTSLITLINNNRSDNIILKEPDPEYLLNNLIELYNYNTSETQKNLFKSTQCFFAKAKTLQQGRKHHPFIRLIDKNILIYIMMLSNIHLFSDQLASKILLEDIFVDNPSQNNNCPVR